MLGLQRPKYLKFLQGSSVTTADQPPSDFLTTSPSQDGRFQNHLSRKDTTNLALYYDLESSEDLINWTPVSAPTTIQHATELWDNISIEIPRYTRSNYYRISAADDPRR